MEKSLLDKSLCEGTTRQQIANCCLERVTGLLITIRVSSVQHSHLNGAFFYNVGFCVIRDFEMKENCLKFPR